VDVTKGTKGGGFRPRSQDAINFLLADVRGVLGPYLNVFLVTQQHWSQSDVGLVTIIGGLLGLSVQTPIGAAIDETRAKRGAILPLVPIAEAMASTAEAMGRAASAKGDEASGH
jgi:hypothetical protein